MSDPTPPRIEVTVSAPPERAWAALRDRDVVAQWHGWQYDGLEDEIDTIFFGGVVAEEPGRRLELGAGDRIDVLPESTGSRIVLTRPPLGADPEWDAYYTEITEGWTTFLQQLAFALDRHPGARRRTLFYSRDDGAPAGTAGVDEVAEGTEPGAAYSAELCGERVSGAVWFRSAHQVGLTVEGWGDGLLVLTRMPPSERTPRGASMAVLTTYGLPDAVLAELDARWAPGWAD